MTNVPGYIVSPLFDLSIYMKHSCLLKYCWQTVQIIQTNMPLRVTILSYHRWPLTSTHLRVYICSWQCFLYLPACFVFSSLYLSIDCILYILKQILKNKTRLKNVINDYSCSRSSTFWSTRFNFFFNVIKWLMIMVVFVIHACVPVFLEVKFTGRNFIKVLS